MKEWFHVYYREYAKGTLSTKYEFKWKPYCITVFPLALRYGYVVDATMDVAG